MKSGWMRRIRAAAVLALAGGLWAQGAWAAEIKNVTARYAWPWGVGISYEVSGTIPANDPPLFVTAKDRTGNGSWVSLPGMLSGDTGKNTGTHRVIWDLDKQGVSIQSENVTFSAAYQWPLYCVIDLSAGANAASYPVTYMNEPPSGGFNTDAYKTTQLVLRRIDPGTFKMAGSYQTTLTKPYYTGIFEVTQKQYQLVTGNNPSQYKDDRRPVEKVSWQSIRGNTNWPASSAVSADSFMGRLRARTGLEFDLPTEAQWEYACRAGTTSDYNNGGNTTTDLKKLGRYSGNRTDGKGGFTNAHTRVGSYSPNAWGLYDMHGNAWEWCLDRHGNLTSGATEPTGATSGTNRVVRGGSWNSSASYCASSFRGFYPATNSDYSSGFRVVSTLPGTAPATAASGTSASVMVLSPGTLDVNGHAVIDVWPFASADEEYGVLLDGKVLNSAPTPTIFDWQPQTLGAHELTCQAKVAITSQTVTAKSLAFAVPKNPEPPTAQDPNIAITPVTRSFGTGGGGGSILVSGSGTWTASASDSWIQLDATSGPVGTPVVYLVRATTNVESRTGYVYVSGHVHTVKQEGLGGASISPERATFETDGGTGTIGVTPPDRMCWQARANVDWINVTPTSGTGAGSVTYTVAPYNEVTTREGTLTVAGQTFTVFQYGRRIKLSPVKAETDALTHVIPIAVDALAITHWTVTPKASWISVVDAGSGQGSDWVTIAISSNVSWKARTGTVDIGTETFTVTQQGRTDLALEISPEATTASVNGANGRLAVLATPDLPWTAASRADWVTIYAQTASGAGNGNVAYSVTPNSTLYERTGQIVVTPGDAGVAAKTHTVTQPAALSALSLNGYEFAAAGESCAVTVSLASNVAWQIRNDNAWLKVLGATNRLGPGTVTLQADPNDTVEGRSGTVTIARKTFKVRQLARGVEVEYESKLFGTDGGLGSFSIHPDGAVAWTAVSSDPSWLSIYGGGEGSGDGELLYVVAPYVGDGEARTGSITVGNKAVYITQRAYDLSIHPTGSVVAGNNGAGEFGVSASLDDVWSAIASEPWMTIIEPTGSGTGSGTVRFAFTENDTGKPRTGKIIVAGEVYTLTQRARELVAISAEAGHGGLVSGAGSYDLGAEVKLTALPDSGYAFSHWTGDVESMENPLVFNASVPQEVQAVFAPLPVAFESVVSSTNGVELAWNNLAWAVSFRLFRGKTSVPSSAELLAEIPNTGDCTFMDETGEVDVEYWYWIEAKGVEDAEDAWSDPMTGKKLKPPVISPIAYSGLKGAVNPNPATYQEGTTVTFRNPGTVAGYTFAGWKPAQITPEMTGAQAVEATWTPNAYRIAYHPNGGSGTMPPTECTYDAGTVLAENGFVRSSYQFVGWGTDEAGGVVYEEGQAVTNLTAASGGVVTLYAVWKLLEVAVPVIEPGDGSVFVGAACEVAISCATAGAAIYFTTDGTTPRVADAFLYAGPFEITNTATIKALAVAEEVRSAYATATLTQRILTLAEAAGAPKLEFGTGGNAEWLPVADAGAVGGVAARSGTIGKNAETWMETTVEGSGTFRFDWRVDCERDEDGGATWDRLAVSLDGAEAARIDGTTDWARMTLAVEGEGEHRVRWTFVKDGYDDEAADFADAGWVSGVAWLPDSAGGLFPAVEEDGEVAAVLADAADARLGEKIGSVAVYDGFRAWMEEKGVDPQAVKDSAHAWPSFALGAAALFANEPVIRFGPSAGGDGGAKAAGDGEGLEVSVTVKDGENAVPVDAGKVAGLFEATGALCGWDAENRLSVSATPTGSDGPVLFFRLVPGDGTAKEAFFRLAP